MTLGQTAYQAFVRRLQDSPDVKDVSMPKWEELTADFQQAWHDAADAVHGSVLRDLRDEGVEC